jgi:ABC-2 type transport system permease protein
MFSLGIFKLGLRQLAGEHRLFFLFFMLVLASLPMLVAFIEIYMKTSPHRNLVQDSREIFSGLILSFVLPVIALIFSNAILREEIQTQTINYLVLKPISRTTIAFSKWLATMVIVLLLIVFSIVTMALVFNDSASLGAYLASGLLAVLAYGAFYFMLSLLMDRVLISGFIYLIAWEGLVASSLPQVKYLTIRYYASNLEQALLGSSNVEMPINTSVSMLIAIIVMSLLLASWKLSRMQFPGSSE